jgi:hypothetical protein
VLQYCISNNLHHLIPSSFPYFKNENIERELGVDSIKVVVDYIIKEGTCLCFILKMFPFHYTWYIFVVI